MIKKKQSLKMTLIKVQTGSDDTQHASTVQVS